MTALVLARTDSLDQYGGVFDEVLLLATRQRRVLCTMSGKGWNADELRDFAQAAGVEFRSEMFANRLRQDEAYPRLPSAVDVIETSRWPRGVALALGLGVPLVIALVVVLFLAG